MPIEVRIKAIVKHLVLLALDFFRAVIAFALVPSAALASTCYVIRWFGFLDYRVALFGYLIGTASLLLDKSSRVR